MLRRVKGRPGVTDHHARDARALLEVLRPTAPDWGGYATNWVFRGQADAEWKLVAKAMRGPDAFIDYDLPGGLPSWSERADTHVLMLDRFRNHLDRAGLPIPTVGPRLLSYEFNRYHSSLWPEPEAFPLMALAQHHGLPTMLLDWSRRPLVAAYFAAVELAEKLKKGSRKFPAVMAVWALQREGFEQGGEPLFYQPPASTNPNLHAQAGLFTLEHVDNSHPDVGLESWLQIRSANGEKTPELRRFLLDAEYAPQLLRLLAQEGVDGCTLFPGADGVVKAMRERVLRGIR